MKLTNPSAVRKSIALIFLTASFSAPRPARAQAPGCAGGVWTPSPVQHAEGGDPTNPAFHDVWGVACGGNVYMVRFGNKIGGNAIVVDIIGRTPMTGCKGAAVWSPSPVQKAQSGDAVNPAFHTVWGLACNGNVYMVRFGNQISGNKILVDILGQTPVQ